ncbi:MAG: ATP-binding protein [Bacteroidota bacterium]
MNTLIIQEKLAYFHHRSQYVVFNNEGLVQDSCHTLFAAPVSGSLYEQIPFMEAMQDTFLQLPVGEDISFLCIQTDLMGREGYYNFYIKRQSEDQLKWFIYDLTEFYSYLQPWQQERNDQAIAGEYLRIQQKAATLEKKLLKYRNEELRRMEQMKTAFFSRVSHEMRTPLNSIVGLAHLLSQQANPATKPPADALEATARHLATIINDVLDWSKLENDSIELDPAPFLVRPLVQNTAEAFRPACQEKGIILSVQIATDVPDCLVGDATRLTQILYNLIGNATKFTHQGEITIATKIASPENDTDTPLVPFRLSVADTGIGMTPEEKKRIATPYVQANPEIHKQYGGTGLGLSIVQKLVSQMNGTWQISSHPGRGTRVTIDLPLPEGTMPTVEFEQNVPAFQHIRTVLIAEDDIINQKVVSQLLLQWGLHPTAVSDGQQAVEQLRQGGYDLLILDYQMPIMDGAAVLATIQQESLALPVIVLSGNADPAILPSCPDNLFHLLSKPILPDVLQEKITFLDQQIPAPLVDLAYLRQITDNQPEVMADLMRTFVQQAPEVVARIQHLWQERDWAEIRKAAHKAKPGFQYIGATAITQILDHLENETQPHDQRAEVSIRQLAEKTQQAVDQIQQELRQLLGE